MTASKSLDNAEPNSNKAVHDDARQAATLWETAGGLPKGANSKPHLIPEGGGGAPPFKSQDHVAVQAHMRNEAVGNCPRDAIKRLDKVKIKQRRLDA